MVTTPAEKKAALLDRIISIQQERIPDPAVAEQLAQFTRQYYGRVAPEDLLEEDLEDLYGAVLSHWNFYRMREPGKPAIRVFNPNFDEHGWESTHTVVEINTDDRPFLVDSVVIVLNRHGLAVHRILHPVFRAVREEGQLKALLPPGEEGGETESVMHFEVDRRTEPGALEAIVGDLHRTLRDVEVAVRDWQSMRIRMLDIVEELATATLPLPAAEVEEVRAFLSWIADNHFTFLGYRCYDLVTDEDGLVLQTLGDSGLGILREEGGTHVSQSFKELPEHLRALAWAPTLLTISKASTRATVHRPVHLDYLGIKRFDNDGKVIGEHRFLGLHTSLAYSLAPRDIPLLREKITRVMSRAGLNPRGHAGKALANILDTFPRDDLFQASETQLYEIAMGILHLQERQRLRLFVRQDVFERFVSCLVYVPRERYNTELRLKMERILCEAFRGTETAFTTQFSESVLARVQLHIRTQAGRIPEYSVAELEGQLRDAMLSWQDHLQRALLEHLGEGRGIELFRRYAQAFPAAYVEDFTTRTAVHDITRLETLGPDRSLAMHLYRPLEDTEGLLRFKLFGPDQLISLSRVLPMLEDLGLQVLTARPYEIVTRDGGELWILDLDMKQDLPGEVDVAEVKDIFQDAFARIWAGEMENDTLNRLVLGARIPWRDVVMLRAYCKYLRQARVPFSQAYMQNTLVKHATITQHLAALFHARFDPDREGREARVSALRQTIEEELEQVSSLDEDRILRRFLALMEATLRTNFFQTDSQGGFHGYLSFKFDPSKIPELPLPRPMFEIFVYSTRTEGVHLRGGPVARGGLRWSDRLEDFRTEVLGLMKAQMVKNSVIVPVGSKGGFVVKRPPAGGGREALQQEVVGCYTTFISGMLDITDNLIEKKVVAPERVVRYDDDDPYLVVAADKGTATFSDLANSIAIKYGFWLGDAFASGGSAGYDHKKMGITARGAWESVKRHFRELGMDIQDHDDFTVVGIGDMGGDVFGNGMLLSRHIKLLAAFNHLHIFIDPDPDPAVTFEERKRLFELPRSTWMDYDQSKLSPGGGIYARTEKSIRLSAEARRVLDIPEGGLTPNELINRLLKAPVDLLWNGGIGTYAKSEEETHLDVGDRANDAVRVNGRELRCRVVGEGGNLGFTQLGRIEYARFGGPLGEDGRRLGGKMLTDAIDNSGGVNCSDHEVNIKVLLNQVMSAGDMTEKQRNQLLAEMTDEVGDLVLRQNYLQPQAISITSFNAPEALGDQARVMRDLERAGKLDRQLEFLPNEEEINERESNGEGLYPPEMAVLLAYSKINLFEELIASDIPEDPFLQNELMMYFPRPLRERYSGEMQVHPLRREIIATYITNSVLNRMGSSYIFRLREATGEGGAVIARAYTAAREMFDSRTLWTRIESLDNQIAATMQIEMLQYSRRLLERASLWLLRHRRQSLDIEATVRQFSGGIQSLRESLPGLLKNREAADFEQACQHFMEAGVPTDLAHWVVSLEVLYSALDLVEVAGEAHLPVTAVADIYFSLASRLEFSWLRESILELPAHNHWQHKARGAMLDTLYTHARALTDNVLKTTPVEETPAQRLDAWLEKNSASVGRCLTLFNDLRSTGQPDMAMLSVAVREVGSLVQGG